LIAAMRAPSVRRYQVDEGVALSVRDWGGTDRMTALLIHGVAEGGFVWDDFASALAEQCRILVVDLRGHGGSDHDPDGDYTVDKFGRDVLTLIEALDVKDLVLVGHSLGADVAVKIAPKLGGRLRGLVVVDSGPDGDNEIASYLQEQLRESHRPYDAPEDYTAWLKDRRYLTPPAVLERLAAASLIRGSDGRFRLRHDVAVLDLITSDEDLSWWLPNLGRAEAPVLVVRGMASASLSRREAERICAAATRGELATVSAAGHAVMNDNREGFAQAVIPFIARACAATMAGTS
jgi:pimeloyl-ACP methyl ester carboxylesterase